MKKITKFCVIQMLAIFSMLSFIGIIIFFLHLIFTSDALASDTIVQEILSAGTISADNYVAQQTFFQFNVLYWFPKLLINLMIPDTILTDKVYVAFLYILFCYLIFLVCKSFTKEKSGWIAIIILSGMSLGWCRYIVMEPAYVLHLIYMSIFLLLCNYSFLDFEAKRTGKQCIAIVFLAIYNFYILSFDQRYAAIFMLPYLLAVCIVHYLEKYQIEFVNELGKRFIKNLSIFLCVTLGSVFVGLAVNSLLKNKLPFIDRLTLLSSYKFAAPQQFFEAVAVHIGGIFSLWGGVFDTNVSTLSLTSMIYLFKMLCCCICMVIIPLLCALRYRKLPLEIKVLEWFYVIMSAILFYVYVFSSFNYVANSRYFVYEIVISLIITSWYLYENVLKQNNLNRYLLICALILFSLISQSSIISGLVKREKEYLEKEELIRFLEAEELEYGYSTYEYARMLTSISNMKINILPVQIRTTLLPFYDINYIYRFSASNYSGKTFLLLSNDEYMNELENFDLIFGEIGQPKETVSVNNYTIFIYDYNIAEALECFPYNTGYVPIKELIK